ncbi:MAG: PP2C family protein-serine/threonine phosphatase [Acidimicrobiales bacterium]
MTATPPESPEAGSRPDRGPFHLVSLVVVAFGLLATAGLVIVAAVTYDHTENRLLELRVKDASYLIQASFPGIETPLSTASEVVTATGEVSQFSTLMAPVLKAGGGTVSASLWTVSGGVAHEVVAVGSPSYLGADPARANSLLATTARTHALSVLKLRGPGADHIGFAFAPAGTPYVGYEEQAIPETGRARVASNNAFANLDYAIYLGRAIAPGNLLTTDVSHPPITGRRASVLVPVGNTVFRLVMTPTTSLGGSFPHWLPWLFGILGVLVSAAGLVLAERLIRRRELAEGIAIDLDQTAAENHRLYDQQRGIADTLQRALLPRRLPEIDRVEIGVRYLPGVDGIEVGGDWYDVIKTDEHEFLAVVGDVSGRGLRAATVMAELRYAIRAYAAEREDPALLLTKLARADSLELDGRFATVLCARFDLAAHRVTLASAGHLAPLLIDPDGSRYVEVPVGIPIGVGPDASYTSVGIPLSGPGTLLAFTDGLVERREQLIDVELEHLRSAAGTGSVPLGELLDGVLDDLGPRGFDDDTAMLGVRWMN